MIQINLLPVRTKKKREAARRFSSIYLLSIALGIAAMGYLWVTNNTEIEGKNRRLAQLNEEIARFSKYEAMLKELTQKKAVVDKKRGIVKSLQMDRDSIVRALTVLSIKTPAEKVYFDRFGQSQNTISLDGVAISNEAVAEFMRNLESSPYVEKNSVNLVLSRQTIVSDRKLRQFQLTYRFFTYSDVEKQLKQKTP